LALWQAFKLLGFAGKIRHSRQGVS
jgi:hypothetical protein